MNSNTKILVFYKTEFCGFISTVIEPDDPKVELPDSAKPGFPANVELGLPNSVELGLPANIEPELPNGTKLELPDDDDNGLNPRRGALLSERDVEDNLDLSCNLLLMVELWTIEYENKVIMTKTTKILLTIY